MSLQERGYWLLPIGTSPGIQSSSVLLTLVLVVLVGLSHYMQEIGICWA